MNVTILGPNLIDQTRGGFHVHVAGCADIGRKREYKPLLADAYYDVEAENTFDVVEAVYGGHGEFWQDNGQVDVEYYEGCAGDFFYFPCTRGLKDTGVRVYGGATALGADAGRFSDMLRTMYADARSPLTFQYWVKLRMLEGLTAYGWR